MEFTYKINNQGNYTVVDMNGNLIDKNQATPLLEEIQTLIDQGNKNFVISMENFKYLNSNGLNVLVNIVTKSRKNGGDSTICNINDKIMELLIITKLNIFIGCIHFVFIIYIFWFAILYLLCELKKAYVLNSLIHRLFYY